MTEADLEKYLDPDKLGDISRGDTGRILDILNDKYRVNLPPILGKPTYTKKIFHWLGLADYNLTTVYKVLNKYFGDDYKKDHDDIKKIKLLKVVLERIMSNKDKKAGIYVKAVRIAMDKKAAMSGGFDIMKVLVNKLRKKKNQNSKYYTDGFDIMERWQREQTNRPFKNPTHVKEDFSVMKNIKKHPTPVKKSLMEPIEVNPPRQIIF